MQKLAPGTRLVFERGAVRLKKYWNLDYGEKKVRAFPLGQKTSRKRCAPRYICISTVTTREDRGYLSGGTDSSSVVAFINERHSPVKTFSIFFEEARYSEAHFARTTSNHFHTRHFEKSISPSEAFRALQNITRFYQEPFANSSAFGAYIAPL